jgi:hypothetical protein
MKDRKSSQPFTGITLQSERRAHPRFTLQVQVELHQDGSDVPMRLTTTDLSRGGCYVQTNMPLSVGTNVQLRLWLGHSSLDVRGRIVNLSSTVRKRHQVPQIRRRWREVANRLPRRSLLRLGSACGARHCRPPHLVWLLTLLWGLGVVLQPAIINQEAAIAFPILTIGSDNPFPIGTSVASISTYPLIL